MRLLLKKDRIRSQIIDAVGRAVYLVERCDRYVRLFYSGFYDLVPRERNDEHHRDNDREQRRY